MVIRSSLRRAVTAVFVGCGVVLGTGAAADRTAVPVVSGTATAAPAVSGTATAATVTALVADDPRGALTALPAGFAEVMGYSPVLEPGFGRGPVLADPRGDCSSPVPLPAAFEPACRVHDLGYDLLRYGRDTDGELGAWARRDLDTQLQRNLHDVCAGEPGPARATCRVAADEIGRAHV